MYSWLQLGTQIEGVMDQERSGWRVSLSDDGKIVAISSLSNMYDGGESSLVRVFSVSCDVIAGCTNHFAENYNPVANMDDGSCIVTGCGNPVSYQGYDYATVQIGEQCWFAENLRSEFYENGDPIPATINDSTLYSSSSTLGAVILQANEYGHFYNGLAVIDERNLCPNEWHVPTDEEWAMMEIALGMPEEPTTWSYVRGTDQGDQMKSTYGWAEDGNGSNSRDFQVCRQAGTVGQ